MKDDRYSYDKSVNFTVECNLDDNAVEINDTKAINIYNKFIKLKFGTILFSIFFPLTFSFLTTLLTATFKEHEQISDFPGIMKGVFFTLFIISACLAVVGLVLMIIDLVKYNEKQFIKALHTRTASKNIDEIICK